MISVKSGFIMDLRERFYKNLREQRVIYGKSFIPLCPVWKIRMIKERAKESFKVDPKMECTSFIAPKELFIYYFLSILSL